MSTPQSTVVRDWFRIALIRLAFDARISASAVKLYVALPAYGAEHASVALSPTALGRDLHMSRATVRTALSQLARAGYVIQGRRGSRLVFQMRNGVPS